MQSKRNFNTFIDVEKSGIDVNRIIKIIKRRWPVIVSLATVVFLVSIVITYTTIPIYTASSQVLLERNRGKSGLESSYWYYEPDFLDTQSEIIRSENVAKKVVENLSLATKYRHYFLSDIEKAEGWLTLLTKNVREKLQFIADFFSEPVSSNSTGDKKAKIGFAPKTDQEIVAQIIRGGLSVSPVINTKIVNISYRAKDPAIAKLVADAVVKAYMDEMLDIKISTSSYSLKWMTAKAAEERDKLELSERELQAFMRENDLVTVENKLTILPQKLSEFGSQSTRAESEKKELQDLLGQINSAKGNLEALEKIPVFASDEVLKAIRERTYKTNQKIQELSKKYGYKHPVMIKAKDELRILKEEKRYEIDRIVSTIENSLELAASKQKSLQDLLEETKEETLTLNEKFMQYSIMKREVDSNRVLFDTLQSSIKQQGVTEQSQSVNIWVIKKAGLPGAPSTPNKKLNLIVGLILGGIISLALAFLLEFLDNTLNTVHQIEERFGLTVLGSIANLDGKEKDIDSHVLYNPLSPIAESYRLIRSALLLSSADQPPKTTLVTSMSKSEGKTVTITNLARMLAQGKKNVLIIDCDLRRPRMHSLLNMPNDTGLSSYLAGNTEECLLLQVPDEEITLVPSGPIPPDPSELLGSEKMARLIQEMEERFDFILLDSPPIGAVTDSFTLSQYVDGTILVVKAASTTIEMFESGVKKMNDINARIIGVVLNRVKISEQSEYQYGYTTYYAKDND